MQLYGNARGHHYHFVRLGPLSCPSSVSTGSIVQYVQRIYAIAQFDWEQHLEEANNQDVIYVPEAASVINILLFAAYDRKPTTSVLDVARTSLSDLRLAIAALKKYGISVHASVSETSLMFAAFASYCPIAALQVYTIAASNAPDLHALAVYASQFLLSLDLSTLDDEVVVEMSPLYLQKLFLLHIKRDKEFKRLIGFLPRPHRLLPHCADTDGMALKEAWAFAMAFLLLSSVFPSTSNSEIDNAVTSVMDKIPCSNCKESLRNHTLDLKQQWSLVKVCSSLETDRNTNRSYNCDFRKPYDYNPPRRTPIQRTTRRSAILADFWLQ